MPTPVIYNIQRHQDPANASALATQVEPIETMTAVDDLTVEFVLNRPFAVFDSAFAQAQRPRHHPVADGAAGEGRRTSTSIRSAPARSCSRSGSPTTT